MGKITAINIFDEIDKINCYSFVFEIIINYKIFIQIYMLNNYESINY